MGINEDKAEQSFSLCFQLSKPFCPEEFNQYFVINVDYTELPVAIVFNDDGDIFLDTADTRKHESLLKSPLEKAD